MKKLFPRPLPLLLLLFVLFFCEKEFDADRPFVRLITLQPTDLDEKGITLHGEFLDLSGAGISDYGFLVDANEIRSEAARDPYILRLSLKKETPKVGKFSFRAEYSLSPGQKYFIRAYAIQGDNIVIGQEFSFVSKGGAANPTITDFMPQNVVPGDTVTIKGTNFTLGSPLISATFGSQEAEIIGTPTDTELKVRAPLRMPFVGRLDLRIGLITVRAEKIYQRLRPEIVSLPGLVKYGTPFLIECKNLSKIPKTNQVGIGYTSSYLNCIVLQENKNSLLVKLDDDATYDLGADTLFLFAENLRTNSVVHVSGPILSSLNPTNGVPEDEINLVCDGVSTTPGVTKVVLNQLEVAPESYTIKNGGKLITFELPHYGFLPGENVIWLKTGRRRSENELTINLDTDLLKLNTVQKNWQYAFNLNDKIFLGVPVTGAPLQVFDPAKKPRTLESISASFNQTFEYAFPIKNDQILALNVAANQNLEGRLLSIRSNNTLQLVAQAERNPTLLPAAVDPLIINGVTLAYNGRSYLYISNGTSNFWEFNAETRQFRPLPEIPVPFNDKAREVILLDQGSKLIAVMFYQKSNLASILTYIPEQNIWQSSGFIGGAQQLNDAVSYPWKPNAFYMLITSNYSDQYILCNENSAIISGMVVTIRKQRYSAKKKTFFFNDRAFVVDDESIYRTKIIK